MVQSTIGQVCDQFTDVFTTVKTSVNRNKLNQFHLLFLQYMFNHFAILILMQFAKTEQKKHIKLHLCHKFDQKWHFKQQTQLNTIDMIHICPFWDVAYHSHARKSWVQPDFLCNGIYISLYEQNVNEKSAAGLPAVDNQLEFMRWLMNVWTLLKWQMF